MQSVILTKINTVKPSFSEHIAIKTSKPGNMEFLRQFVKHCHKNAKTTEATEVNSIYVHGKHFVIYRIFEGYITKLNVDTNRRTFYKIS